MIYINGVAQVPGAYTDADAVSAVIAAGGVFAATLADFQATPGVGGGGWTAQAFLLNDNDTGTLARTQTLNSYVEVDFGKFVIINQWRQFGNINNNADGVWKIQYSSGGGWVDWVTGIPTRATADWSNMAYATSVITNKIRLVATTIDTSTPMSRINELEVYHSAP